MMENMFVKLTRLNGAPIWVKRDAIVTIEPRQGSGSLVVPMGDGMDYEVQENPERVIAKIQAQGEGEEKAMPKGEKLRAVEDVPAPAPVPVVEKPQEQPKVPVKEVAEQPAPQKTAWTRGRRVKSVLTPDEQARLQKMRPGSVGKLINTLKIQFKVEDPGKEARAQDWAGHIKVSETGRIEWQGASQL